MPRASLSGVPPIPSCSARPIDVTRIPLPSKLLSRSAESQTFLGPFLAAARRREPQTARIPSGAVGPCILEYFASGVCQMRTATQSSGSPQAATRGSPRVGAGSSTSHLAKFNLLFALDNELLQLGTPFHLAKIAGSGGANPRPHRLDNLRTNRVEASSCGWPLGQISLPPKAAGRARIIRSRKRVCFRVARNSLAAAVHAPAKSCTIVSLPPRFREMPQRWSATQQCVRCRDC